MEDYYWLAARKSAAEQALLPPPPSSATKDKDHVVDVVNNMIYFYSEVSRPKILELNKAVNNLSTNLVTSSALDVDFFSTTIMNIVVKIVKNL